MAKEKMNPIWLVWEVKPGRYPALRAVCETEKIAHRYKNTPQSPTDGDRFIEKNLTNHLYGEADYDVAKLYIRNKRTPREGD